MVYEKNALAFQQHEAELKLIALLATSSATDGLYLEMQPWQVSVFDFMVQ